MKKMELTLKIWKADLPLSVLLVPKRLKSPSKIFTKKTDNLGPRDLARGGRAGGPIHDAEGHSGESDEGIVADHAPFNGV